MIRKIIDLTLSMLVVLYARMSTDDQNERSPDQQFREIRDLLLRQGRPWTVVGEYRDDGISGRLVAKRPGLMELIRDIKTGKIKVGAILVHTLERWGRAEEMARIRSDLWKNHGVLLLTYDSNFADPTTIAGQALGFFEQMRATSAAPVKAHDIFRGKKDAVLLKHWPGGPPPFGYKLKYHMTTKNGKPEVDFATLEEESRESWIICMTFEKAAGEGLGGSRLAKWLNHHPAIPLDQRNFYASTIDYWLTNPIYYGELLWNENATDVIDDVRVIQKNDEADWVRVPDFCAPLISRELWDIVQNLRNLRCRKKRPRSGDDAGLPPGVGRTLKHILSGLVRCGTCGCSMNPSASARRSKSGKSYCYYTCQRYQSGMCDNGKTVREDRLTQAVVAALRQKLFPVDPAIPIPSWLPSLFDQVRAELARLADSAPDRADGLRQQIGAIEIRMAGWVQSLGKPDLPAGLRNTLAAEYEAAAKQRDGLQRDLEQLGRHKQLVEELLDPNDVLTRLKRLNSILGGTNPTLTNVELSRHIDRIDAYPDGRVLMHGSRLGLLKGAIGMLSAASPESVGSSSGTPVGGGIPKVVPRARPKLRIDSDEVDASDPVDASDVGRFAALDSAWMWNEELLISETTYWFQDYAAEVTAVWSSDPKFWTMPKLAEKFGKTIPTIRKALRTGQAAAGINVPKRKCAPKGVQDAREIAEAVGEMYLASQPPPSIRQIAARYGVDQITISKALNIYYKSRGLIRPDGRKTRSHRNSLAKDSEAGPAPEASVDPARDTPSSGWT